MREERVRSARRSSFDDRFATTNHHHHRVALSVERVIGSSVVGRWRWQHPRRQHRRGNAVALASPYLTTEPRTATPRRRAPRRAHRGGGRAAPQHPALTISCVSPGFIDTAICAGFGATKPPSEGTVSIVHCLFAPLEVTGGDER